MKSDLYTGWFYQAISIHNIDKIFFALDQFLMEILLFSYRKHY